jgi:hypothetical protein
MLKHAFSNMLLYFKILNLNHYKIIYFQKNLIKEIEGLDTLMYLEYLSLNNNYITGRVYKIKYFIFEI